MLVIRNLLFVIRFGGNTTSAFADNESHITTATGIDLQAMWTS